MGLLAMLDGVLAQLAAAETQQQFDQAVRGAMMPLLTRIDQFCSFIIEFLGHEVSVAGTLKEAKRILDVYEDLKKKDTELSYQYCSFKANPKYPGIGFIQLFYLAQVGDDIIDDAISFECIYTNAGWKIIDGFYQESP